MYDTEKLLEACRTRGMKDVMDEIEFELVYAAMEGAGQVCAHAAQSLGLNRSTLVEKRRKLGMELYPRGGRFS